MSKAIIKSPTFRPFTLDEDMLKKPLCRLDVWAPGDVSIIDMESNAKTRTFAAPFPQSWWVEIRKVVAATTTVNLSNLDGLHGLLYLLAGTLAVHQMFA